MFIAALFIIARNWKKLNGRMDIENVHFPYIYTMEYYSAIKNKDIMDFADKWIEVENIILSKITQIPKTFMVYIH